MLLVLSPAKSLDFTLAPDLPLTKPRLLKHTRELAAFARGLTPADLRALMHISEPLAALNHARFQRFDPRGAVGVQAALAFAGDVYRGLDARTLDAEALGWAQDHLRILSGLYGVLRPLDRIRPYRLEMGIALKTERGATLYDFWGDRLAKQLNADAKGHADRTLINLASQEYFGGVDTRALKLPLVNVHFKEERDGQTRILAFYAKRARGLMARYAIDHRMDEPEGLKGFDTAGYRFDVEASTDRDWTFVRRQPEAG
jgi:hypothetical protein